MEAGLLEEEVHADGGVVADVELADFEESAAVAEAAYGGLVQGKIILQHR